MFGLGAPELLIIIMVLGIPVAIVMLIIRASRRSTADPLTVLGERLARGEITPAEYDELRRRLG